MHLVLGLKMEPALDNYHKDKLKISRISSKGEQIIEIKNLK